MIHRFCRELQQQPEVEEKTSPGACDGSHINLCPAASSWQIKRKGRSSSVVSKRSNTITSKTTCLQDVNSFTALYEPDEDECGLLTCDDQINSFAHSGPLSKGPTAGPFRVAVVSKWGLLSAIPTRLTANQVRTTYLYRANMFILFADMYDKHVSLFSDVCLRHVYARCRTCVSALPPNNLI